MHPILLFSLIAGLIQIAVRAVIFRLRMYDKNEAAINITINIYLFLIVFPIVVMAILAVLILHKTPATKREFTNIVAAVAIAYCLCKIPYIIDFFYLSLYSRRLTVLMFLSNFFTIVNCTLNFFIYFVFSSHFKKAFRRLFFPISQVGAEEIEMNNADQ